MKTDSIIIGKKQNKDIFENCDVCVVGTGAGGATIAAELAEGGLNVIMIEEGGYYPQETFTHRTTEMTTKLYRNAGVTAVASQPTITFSEGRCVGGSTVINGGVCWRTPENWLDEWHAKYGIEKIKMADVDSFFSKVESRINAAPQDDGSVGIDDALLKKGAEKLGYTTVQLKRNQINCVGTNNCLFGCPTGAKQSTLLSYIPRALNNGTRIFSDCKVNKIHTQNGKATGVSGIIKNNNGRKIKLSITAKKVVIAGGAVQSPLLLLRNGIANNSGEVGKNFMLHPNTKVVGIYDEVVKGWQGTIQGHQVHEFLSEGIMITTTMVPPAILSLTVPYIGDDTWNFMNQYNHMVVAGALIEDVHCGRVRNIPGINVEYITYPITAEDNFRFKRSVYLTAKILFASGAKKCYLPIHGLDLIHSPDELDKIMNPAIKPTAFDLFTVHLMGTARMGNDPKHSVVNGFLESHDVKDLYVVDASVFPTPIGVNPQVTIMMLATRTADYILNQ